MNYAQSATTFDPTCSQYSISALKVHFTLRCDFPIVIGVFFEILEDRLDMTHKFEGLSDFDVSVILKAWPLP